MGLAPGVYELDLQLSRPFVLGSRVTVEPTIACFNLTDSHTVLGRNQVAGSYDATEPQPFGPDKHFNGVWSTLGDRSIRGGVRISFSRRIRRPRAGNAARPDAGLPGDSLRFSYGALIENRFDRPTPRAYTGRDDRQEPGRSG
jgi:hypothetical protein